MATSVGIKEVTNGRAQEKPRERTAPAGRAKNRHLKTNPLTHKRAPKRALSVAERRFIWLRTKHSRMSRHELQLQAFGCCLSH
jgi:hypothetical protein